MGSPVLIPTQQTPLMNDGSNLVCVPWYTAFDQLRQQVNILIAAAAGMAPAVVACNIQQVALSHTGVTNIVPAVAPTVGALLSVTLTQDSTGGNQVTWQGGAGNFAAFLLSTGIGGTPNAISKFLFVGESFGGSIFWVLTAMPMLNQT
jgi:hypothetical protein